MYSKTALQRDLDRFYKELYNEKFNIREVTKGALTQARAKLKPWAFIRLNEVAVNSFYEDAPYYKWHEKRVFAIDGTRLMLPNHPSVKEEFGEHSFGPKADTPRSIAIASIMYDVLNNVVLDSQIDAYTSNEISLLEKHLEKMKRGDMLLLDRGYPSFWLLFLLKAKGIDFCVRLKEKNWLEARALQKSGTDERIVTFSLPKKDLEKLSEYPDYQLKTIKCRLVKVDLENGETEILCTSLIDKKKVPKGDIALLYHLRWEVEEAFKMLKSRVELESFSGKTANSVRQDFHAKIFMLSMCSAMAFPIEERVRKEYYADLKSQHPQKINRTHAITMFMDMVIPAFLKNKIKSAIESFDNIVYKTRELIRFGRSFERKNRTKRLYHMNYKAP